MSDETPKANAEQEPVPEMRRRQALTQLGLTTAAVYSAPVLTRLWGRAHASYGGGQGGEYGGGEGGEYGGGEGGEFGGGEGGEFGGRGPCSAPPCGRGGGKGPGDKTKKHWSYDG